VKWSLRRYRVLLLLQVVASSAELNEMGVLLGEVIAGGCAALTSPFIINI